MSKSVTAILAVVTLGLAACASTPTKASTPAATAASTAATAPAATVATGPNADVTIASCTVDGLLGPTAKLTVTNHSSKTSNYIITSATKITAQPVASTRPLSTVVIPALTPDSMMTPLTTTAPTVPTTTTAPTTPTTPAPAAPVAPAAAVAPSATPAAPPVAPFTPVRLSGTGSRFTPRMSLPVGGYTFAWTAAGGAGQGYDNFSVTPYTATGQRENTLVNVILPNPSSGRLSVFASGNDFFLSIQAANVTWTITITAG